MHSTTRTSASPNEFALVSMLVLLGVWTFETTLPAERGRQPVPETSEPAPIGRSAESRATVGGAVLLTGAGVGLWLRGSRLACLRCGGGDSVSANTVIRTIDGPWAQPSGRPCWPRRWTRRGSEPAGVTAALLVYVPCPHVAVITAPSSPGPCPAVGPETPLDPQSLKNVPNRLLRRRRKQTASGSASQFLAVTGTLGLFSCRLLLGEIDIEPQSAVRQGPCHVWSVQAILRLRSRRGRSHVV